MSQTEDSSKKYQEWVHLKGISLRFMDQEVARLKLRYTLEDILDNNCTVDHRLLEVFRELALQQDLR